MRSSDRCQLVVSVLSTRKVRGRPPVSHRRGTWLIKAQPWSLAVALDRTSHKVKSVLTQGWGQRSGALLCFVPDLKWSGSSLEGGRGREMVGCDRQMKPSLSLAQRAL